MRNATTGQYNTAPLKSRVSINMADWLLKDIDRYRENLATTSGQPKVSRSLAITRLLAKAKQGGLFNEFA